MAAPSYSGPSPSVSYAFWRINVFIL